MKLNIKDNYGIAPNSLLNNKEMSLRAKGLFAYIQSKPDGWNFSAERIALSHVEGKESIMSALKELENHGYLIRQKIHGERGKWEQTYILTFPATTVLPTTVEPSAVEPSAVNPYNNSNIDYSKKDIVNKSIVDERFEKFWGLYNKEVAKDKCYSEWKYINTIDKDKILKALPTYIQATPDIQYRKNPLKYLKEKAWLDVVVPFENKRKEDISPLARPVSVISVPNDY
jgi:hypothetical protein